MAHPIIIQRVKGIGWLMVVLVSDEWRVAYHDRRKPYGGNFSELAINNSGKIVIMENSQKKLYRSDNFGQSWDYISSPNPSGDGYYPSQLTTFGTGNFYCYKNSEFYVSTDNGSTWQPFASQLNSYRPNFIYYDLALGHFYITTSIIVSGSPSNKIFKSTDNGTSWNEISSNFLNDERPVCLTKSNSGRLYIGTEKVNSVGAIYVSTDNGATWNKIYSGNILKVCTVNSYIYAITTSHILIKSLESDYNWQNIRNANDILIRGDRIYAGGDQSHKISYSDNYGSTWVDIVDVNLRHGVLKLAFNPINNELYATNTIGIFKSSDAGMPWSNVSNVISIIGVNSIMKFNGSIIVNGYWISNDRGNTWDRWSILESLFDPDSVKAIGSNGLLVAYGYRSVDNGQTWSLMKIADDSEVGYPGSTFSIATAGHQSQSSYLFHKSGAIFALEYNRFLWRSDDNGATWKNNAYKGVYQEYGWEILGDNDGTIYILDTDWNIYRSTDTGKTWQNVLSDVDDIAIGPDGTLFASEHMPYIGDGTTKIYRSMNKGNTWEIVSEVNGDGQRGLIVGPGKTLFAQIIHLGTSNPYTPHTYDVIRSNDYGVSWNIENSGLADESKSVGFLFDDEGYLYMGGTDGSYNGYGIYRSRMPILGKPSIVMDNNELSFGEVEFAGGSSLKSVKITNTGDADLNTTITLGGSNSNQFTLDIEPGNITIPHGANNWKQVNITFDPDAPGGYSERNAYLSIEHDDPNLQKNNPILIPLYGISVPVELSLFQVD